MTVVALLAAMYTMRVAAVWLAVALPDAIHEQAV